MRLVPHSEERDQPDWQAKLRAQNLQVLRHMEEEKRQQELRDSLREHGDRVRIHEIKNTSIGK